MVANHLLLVVCCITSFRLVFVRFELLRILLQLEDKYHFSTPMKTHTMVRKVKKQNNFILIHELHMCFICVSDVFRTHFRVSNNRTVIIICFVLKSSLYDAYPRPCGSEFYLLISPARIFYSAESFTFKSKRNAIRLLCWFKQYCKHSICDKSLFILMFLFYYICHS